MTSTERKRIRHAEILKLRAEGRAAAYAGKSVHSCRREYCDKSQWEQGYYEAQRDIIADAEREAERQRREYEIRKEQVAQQKLEELIRRIVHEELARLQQPR
jgi:hypothetical protein